ncbi:hypothetical protein Tco_0303935, partial [Tanacetum coccineum]
MRDENIKNTRGVRFRGYEKRKERKERMARGEEYKRQERCGYCKNYKKTVKTGQKQTRDRKSTQRARRMLSTSRMV